MEKIVIIQLNLLAKRLWDRHVSLKWDAAVIAHLAKEGYDPTFGARPLKRYIQTEVVNMLATAILEGKIPSEGTIELYMNKNKIDFRIKAAK